MVTLQDLSFRLMKPAKDLADWSFPLSQILEEYYALLEEPCNVNFGEAALVLQNSANVYVHRVECLFDRMQLLKQMFVGCEDVEEETKKGARGEKRSSRRRLNLEDFDAIDLEKELGKNINVKARSEAQKTVKLISRRFAQLEANVTQLNLPVQVYDVYGEVVGKKYDFRCNQPIDVNGVLVEELTPGDFNRSRGSSIKERRNPSLTFSEANTHRTVTSGYQSNLSPCEDRLASTAFAEDLDEDSSSSEGRGFVEPPPSNFLTPPDSSSAIVLSGNPYEASKDPTEPLDAEKEPPEGLEALKDAFGGPGVEEDNRRGQETKEGSPEGPGVEEEAQRGQERKERGLEGPEGPEVQEECGEGQKDSHNDSGVVLEEQNGPCEVKGGGKLEKERKNADSEVKTAEETKKTNRRGILEDKREDPKLPDTGVQTRGSQRASEDLSASHELDESAWRPMDLNEGEENEDADNFSPLKLPSYASTLRSKSDGRKRRVVSKARKQECLTKFVLRQLGVSEQQMVSSSLAKTSFRPLRRQELEDFQKAFDACFLGPQELALPRYLPVTDSSTDLLGFRLRPASPTVPAPFQAPSPASPPSTPASNPPSPVSSPPASPFALHSPVSPFLAASPGRSDSDSEDWLRYGLPDYQTLIEDRMKEIFREEEVATELESSVARWHRSLQPKLSEAERRPAFRIQEYAGRIMGTLEAAEERRVEFERVVRGKPACEVARYFLASLQLANTYNVEINASDSDDRSIEIILLDGRKSCKKKIRPSPDSGN